ncbi:oxidoreductase [Lithospermum erythrorhizon]|uniref:Oxidoreductase n=1 Tax=Lithospermum erythrorhizon TaxID=34254 RepID=A0AAV3RF03_LITER
MQEAIPHKSWLPILPLNQSTPNLNKTFSPSSSNPNNNTFSRGANFEELVSENAVIVFSRKGCCMSHVVKRLLQGLGVNPPVYEVDEQDEEKVIKKLGELMINDTDEAKAAVVVERMVFPAVFIGGKFFGGLDRIMATHITGELTPVLKQAGALWL